MVIKRLLSVGPFPEAGLSNTTELRHQALMTYALEADKVTTNGISIFYRLANKLFNLGLNVRLPDVCGANARILELASNKKYDLLWIDKGITIRAEMLREFSELQPGCKIIGYSPDLMTARHNQSRQFIESLSCYDAYVTTKSYAIDDMYGLGCKCVIYQGNAFQEDFHYPREVDEATRARLGGDIGFIGAWEMERARSVLFLVKNGLNVRVWGDGRWLEYRGKFPNLKIEGRGLYSSEYCEALTSFKISLCFLRKMNSDQQTTRSIEIPACGSFMLAERTAEHEQLFEDGSEACFFSSDDELLLLCRKYLENDSERERIAKAGRNRCITSGYSYKERIGAVLSEVLCD